MNSRNDIVIIRYNAGNIRSVDFALQRLGLSSEITDDHEKIRNAGKVIFPGVGEASGTMEHLRERGLDSVIKELKQPVLGICLGMQLMCRFSEEGNTSCLGIFDADVVRFRTGKVPHMGWNELEDLRGYLYDNSAGREFVYFVHSYYVPEVMNTTAVSDYGCRFSASLERDNFFATQYHPEKSGSYGEKILQRFIQL
ncbi:MAG: imidazole glycerol phosphate synthase subunit HisH [Marinilabiliales bacterium]|nr:MAG: imidazole glycerol phosphate synthase subunit HisH [Marinilabiliales bacterium]